MTCEQFAELESDSQVGVVAWADGYRRAVTQPAEIGEIEIDRQVETIVTSCTETPQLSLWRKLEAMLPGGKKRVQPEKMSCEEFVSLDASLQPELVAFARGYDQAKRQPQEVYYEEDLETDVVNVLELCKREPRESFWRKLRSKL
jgi:hypothetical protein